MNQILPTTQLSKEQEDALEFLKNRKRFILADSTGTGKTLSMLAAYDTVKDENTHMIVFANKSALVTWRNEIKKHTSFSTYFVNADNITTVAQLQHDISIFPYSLLTGKSRSKEQIKQLVEYIFSQKQITLVLEEAHYCKNPRTERYQTVLPFVRSSSFCWAITATPMVNDLLDLYWLFDLLIPGYLGSKRSFEARYIIYNIREAYKKKNKYGGKLTFKEVKGYQNLEELKERIKPFLLKRVKDYNVKFHVSNNTFRADEEEAYTVAARGMLGIKDYRDFAARLPDLQRIVDNSTEMGRVKNTSTRLATKETILLRGMKEQLDSGECIIVYADFYDTLDRLRYVFENVKGFEYNTLYILDGSTTLTQRTNIQKHFGPGDILLMTSAGKESLNLQQSHILWLYDIPFSLGATLQVIGRIARMDSKFEQFDVYLPVIIKTIDEYKAALLLHNADVFSAVLSGEKTLPKSKSGLNKTAIIKMRKHLLWRFAGSNNR